MIYLFLYLLELFIRVVSEMQGRPGLSSLRNLLSGIPVPREGEDGDDSLVMVAPAPPPPEPLISQQFSNSLPTLRKLQGDGNTFFQLIYCSSNLLLNLILAEYQI